MQNYNIFDVFIISVHQRKNQDGAKDDQKNGYVILPNEIKQLDNVIYQQLVYQDRVDKCVNHVNHVGQIVRIK